MLLFRLLQIFFGFTAGIVPGIILRAASQRRNTVKIFIAVVITIAVTVILLLSLVRLISPEYLTEFIQKIGDELLSLIDSFDLYQLRYLAEDNSIAIIFYLLGIITGWMLTGSVIFIRGSKMPKRLVEAKQTKEEPKGEEQKPPPQQEDRKENYI